MWVIAQRIAILLFGDKAIKYALYGVAGLFVFTFVEAGAAAHAIMAQPFGQWTLAAMEGSQIAASLTPVVIPRTQSVPVPQVANDRTSFAIAQAMTWINVPYLWGGCTRSGIDCSCFVQRVLATILIVSPRVTVDQIRWAVPVNRNDLQPLDLVFFDNTCTGCGANPTHVGIYIGNGMMIQAGGSAVSIQPVFSGFYGNHFAAAGRPH